MNANTSLVFQAGISEKAKVVWALTGTMATPRIAEHLHTSIHEVRKIQREVQAALWRQVLINASRILR